MARHVSLSWQRLLRHHYDSSLLQMIHDNWKETAIITRESPAHYGIVDQSAVYAYYQFLKTNQADPIMQLSAWRLVNPAHLSPQVLATQLPLLDLVDSQANGTLVLEVLRTLTGPMISTLVRHGWSASDLQRMNNLAIGGTATSAGESKWSHWFVALYSDIVAIIMARLGTTNRFDVLQAFILGLEQVMTTWPECINTSLLFLGMIEFSIVLAAVARQTPALDALGDFYTTERAQKLSDDLDTNQCILAKNMRDMGLPQGAEMLSHKWNCDQRADEDLFGFGLLPAMRQL
ncbi:hypothetical protein H4R33_006984, partial [Dimargaris cristalligena]